MSNWSVMVVEDDLSSSDILVQILEHNGMVVDTASTGEDALQLLNGKQYDLAILDLALPGMDGWQLHEEMKSMVGTENTIIIALTAYYTPLLAKQAKEAGFVAAFPKPITEALISSLKDLR